MRDGLLRAFTVWGVLVFGITETLSAGHLLAPTSVQIAWGVACLVLLSVHRRKGYTASFGGICGKIRGLGWRSGLPLFFVGAATLAVAIAAPPNNWDSMTYHMARVANWAQNGDVQHYPTHIIRQLMLSPWAEYAILNLQLLAGGSDRWANLVQWVSYVISALAASLIIAKLGGRREVQLLGALLVLTAPMLILQATSTQNDLVVAAWLAAFVYFLFEPDQEWFFPAVCLGLAVNTKGTAIAIAPVFLLAAWFIRGRSSGWQRATFRAVKISGLALLLNIPFLWRNLQTFGHPEGDPQITQTVNMQVHDPVHLASNILRNASLHMGAPVGRVTWAVERAVNELHSIAGVDPSDKRTSYTAFHVLSTSNHEDEAGNPIQFWLLIVASAVLFLRRRQFRDANLFSTALALSFVLFCWLIKFQVWGSRLHVPFFVLGAAVTAIGVDSIFRSDRALRRLGLLLVVASLPWLLFNRTRPLVTVAWNPSLPPPAAGTLRSMLVTWLPSKSVLTANRDSMRYVNRPALRASYHSAFSRAVGGGCSELGLITRADSWEYPLHVLAAEQRNKVWFRHVGVTNSSRRAVRETRPVCAVLVLDSALAHPPVLPGMRFRADWQDSVVQLFRSQ